MAAIDAMELDEEARRLREWMDAMEPDDSATQSETALSDIADTQAAAYGEGGASPKDADISANVDHMMKRIRELKRLTNESLEVEVERLAPCKEETAPSSSSCASNDLENGTANQRRPSQGSSAMVEVLADAGGEQSGHNPAAMHENLDQDSTCKPEQPDRHDSACIHEEQGPDSACAPERPRKNSATIFEGIEAAIQHVQSFTGKEGEGSKTPDSECTRQIDVENVLDTLRDRIGSIEKQMGVWRDNLVQSESRIRTELFTELEQAIESKVVSLQPSRDKLPEDISPRIRTELFTELEQAIESKVASLQPVPHSQSFGLETIPESQKTPAALSEVPANSRRHKLPCKTSSSPSRSSTASMPQHPASSSKQRRTGINNTAKTGHLVDFQPQDIADVAGEMAALRQEIHAAEERLKTFVHDHVKSEIQASVGCQQGFTRDVDKDAKALLCDGVNVRKMTVYPNSARPHDVSSVGSAAFDSTRFSDQSDSPTKNDAPVRLESRKLGETSSLSTKGAVDMQLGNVASRCAWLAETVSSSSGMVEEQVEPYMLQLSNDLEKVASYLSGALQLQLESMTEVISFIQGQLENITRILVSPGSVVSSKLSTTASSWPWPRSQTPSREQVSPSVTSVFSEEESKTSQPRSASPLGFREIRSVTNQVCLGHASASTPLISPPRHSQSPRRGQHQTSPQISPASSPKPPGTSFAPSLRAMGPGTPQVPPPGGPGPSDRRDATPNPNSHVDHNSNSGDNSFTGDHSWMGS